MKKSARILSLALALILAVSLMGGCGAKPETGAPKEAEATAAAAAPAETKAPEPKEVVTLKFWGGVPPESGPQESCDNFNKEFEAKGIRIEYERFVNDDQGNLKLETNLLAGSDIDLYVTYSLTRLLKRAPGNLALDLTELTKRDNYDIPAKYGDLTKIWAIDGKFYSVPTTKGNVCIIANKDMFDAAGIPLPTSWTLDEFREIAKKLTKGEGQDKVYGMYFTGKDTVMNMVNTTLGTDWAFKPGDKESNFNHPIAEKYLQTEYDMMHVDKSAPTYVDEVTQKLTIEGMFLSGKAAMSVGAWITRSIRDVEKYPHDFKTVYLPYPVADKDSQFHMYGTVGDALCINPKSKHIDEAWEFIKWYGEKGMEPLIPGGRVPSAKSFDLDRVTQLSIEGAENLIDADSYKKLMITTAERYGYNSAPLPEIKKILEEEVEYALTKKKTVKEALDSLKARADEVLKSK